MTNANLTQANLTNTGFSSTNLINVNLSQANLSNAYFAYSTLKGAIFENADIRGASFIGSTSFGFTLAQLQSTASYKAKDLSGMNFSYSNDFSDWDFHDQNLTNDHFYNAILSNTNLTGADTRGASYINYSSAITFNTIHYDGTIKGLDLSAGNTLLVRDYDGNPTQSLASIPITVKTSMNMGTDGVLRMIFEQDVWDSKISFAPGIAVMLGGTLNLTFADGIDLSSQVGRTFSLFDWSGVSPTGRFNTDSPYVWDLSNLYTTGDVTLLAVPESATITLLATGFLCVFAKRFYNRKRHLPGFHT